MYLKKKFLVKLFFCVFALLATQELQAMPYIYSHHSSGATTVTSQLLSTRTYNAEGQLASEGVSAGKLTSYTYYTTNNPSLGQSIGQLSTTTDRDRNVINNTYTDHEQLRKSWAVTKAGTTMDTLTPQYDSGDGQLTGSTYQQNLSTPAKATTLQYNLAGELSSNNYSDGKTQSYTYNLNGSTKSFTNVLNQPTNYTYTPMHQLSTVVFKHGTTDDVTTYTYDEFGRKTNETRPNGVQTNWTYDDYNGVKAMTSLLPSSRASVFFSRHPKRASSSPVIPSERSESRDLSTTAQELKSIGYTYYPNGNIATETPSPGITYAYQYNPLNQLQSFTCTKIPGSKGVCPKDSHGNTISNNLYSYTLNNGIATITTKNTNGETNTATYNYYLSHPDRLKNITNSNNNLNQPGTYIYDNNGNVTTDGKGDTISYDALNQMLTLKNSQGAVTHYGYDGNGKMNQETPAGQTTPINEYYGGNGKIVTAKIQGTAATTYAMGLDRIAQYYFENTAQPVTSTQYYLYDQRGSVTNVLGSSSNTGYVYSPFGFLSTTGSAKKKSTASLNNNTFGYIGQSLDQSTGLMMMGGYRAYNPAVGNFLKQDSYTPFKGAGTFNGFNYGAGNPILFEDPSGHSIWDWIGGITGALVGSALMAATMGLIAPAVIAATGLTGASAAAVTIGAGVVGGAVNGVAARITSLGIKDLATHESFSSSQWASVGIAAGVGAAAGLIVGSTAAAIAARRAAGAAGAAGDDAVADDAVGETLPLGVAGRFIVNTPVRWGLLNQDQIDQGLIYANRTRQILNAQPEDNGRQAANYIFDCLRWARDPNTGNLMLPNRALVYGYHFGRGFLRQSTENASAMLRTPYRPIIMRGAAAFYAFMAGISA